MSMRRMAESTLGWGGMPGGIRQRGAAHRTLERSAPVDPYRRVWRRCVQPLLLMVSTMRLGLAFEQVADDGEVMLYGMFAATM